ncbi:AraC family transcriptional regulator [Pelomonas sp. CA6]|uniref:AraC family transcriptional regulator n=1 Tax=Pelomonas sp. CA6 TaxID=2907999 RepID=UPI001F4BB55D|nr:AraC family transcriptional regulator [Pelomonas sp. CA6]MCH7342524.1 AraC family transcriptional regulator [Pelomonas sp. CA6]
MGFEHPQDQAQYRRPAHRAGVELYHANILRHSFEPHTHEAYGLGAITAGVGAFRWRGGEHFAPRASLMLMNPDDLHTGRAASGEAWGYRMVYLQEGLLRELCGGSAWSFHAAVAHDAEASARAAALIAALWRAQEPLAFDSLLMELLQTLARHARHGPAPADERASPRFAAVTEYMRAHLERKLSTEELAAVAGLSPFHFLRSFKSACDATPQQALMVLRLAEAKRRLAGGEAPAAVAAAVGLTDQAHLTRQFARRYGVTPSRYQQQVGAAQARTRPAG